MTLKGFNLSSISLRRFGQVQYFLDDLVSGGIDEITFTGEVVIGGQSRSIEVLKNVIHDGILVYVKGFVNDKPYLGTIDFNFYYNNQLFSTLTGMYDTSGRGVYSVAMIIKPSIPSALGLGYGFTHIGKASRRWYFPEVEDSRLECDASGCREYEVWLNYGSCSDSVVELLVKGVKFGEMELSDCRGRIWMKLY